MQGNTMWWKGKEVDKMTKAELIQAIYEMVKLYEQGIESKNRLIEALKMKKER